MDPTEAVGLMALSGAVAGRLFGPAADEFAELLRSWTALRIANTQRMIQRVDRRDTSDADGSVAPRIAARVLEDGSWISDPVTQEYYAGLLLGARSPDGVDDAALFWVDVVTRMTTNQIRLHHAIYAAIADEPPGGTPLSDHRNQLLDHSVTAPLDEITFLVGDASAAEDAIAEAVVGLHHLSLVDSYAVNVNGMTPGRPSMSATPTNMGLLLFLRAYASRSTDLDAVTGFTPVTGFDPPGPRFTSATIGDPEYVAGPIDLGGA